MVIAVPLPGSFLARELSNAARSTRHFRIDRGDALV